MAGFEPGISGIKIDHSSICAADNVLKRIISFQEVVKFVEMI